ncbi:MAG: leukotriene A4 hydrolase C-terminal domain-containing protein [Polyangiaceae bacterium]
MRHDPHSYTDLTQGRTASLRFDWSVDFTARKLRGTVRIELEEASEGPLDLDTVGLTIESVSDDEGRPIPYELAEAEPVLGRRLRVRRDRALEAINVRYTTGDDASALMWLEPSQTDGGEAPFVLTQCQPIHARSLAPLQDSPMVRATYEATLTIPAGLSAVMSAAPGEELPATESGTRRLAFSMPQRIPAYLLALAVGDIASRDLGPRTRVYAEPGVVEAAAWEFDEVERMLEAAEQLFGPYAWERYDFIVLPPSFPMGGMENPRMTFLTPTLLAGDRSLVSVLAHELAHSWTGNLVTNATNEDFWLNEGWTVYAERRIIEALHGPETAAQEARLGRVVLEEAIAERVAAGQKTALNYPQAGLDPDGEFSKVPYEKGFLLVTALERAVGREAFDAFIQRYMERFHFESLTTAGFADFVRETLPKAAEAVDLDTWLHGEGLPEDAPTFDSPRLDELAQLGAGWTPGTRPSTEGWTTTETLFFLSKVPPQDRAATEALGDWLGLRTTKNAELQCVWLARAAEAGVADIEPELRDFVGRVGRTKLVKPVIAAMAASPRLRPLAEELVATNQGWWHSSTRNAVAAVMRA